MMRVGERLLVGLLWLTLIAPLAASPASARIEARILLDYDTGTVLDAGNADDPVVPASLTKMMTLYLTFRALEAGQLKLSSELPISARAAGMPPTKLGLRPGDTIDVEDAILGLVTRSANDAAAVLGEALGGSESRFGLIMTRTARDLGMTRTVFRNASGLPDAKQLTTARDLARLATRLITDYPEYYRYFSRPSFTYGGRVHGNHNRLLATYPGMDGLKTGYTRASGFNLAASAVQDGRRVVAVVIGGETSRARDAKMVALLDRGFAMLRRQQPNAPLLVASRSKPVPAAPALDPSESDGEVVLASLDADDPAAAVALPIARPKEALVERPETRSDRPGKAAKKAVAVAKPSRGKLRNPYGVQVGTFQKSKQARQALQSAMRRAPDLLRGTIVSVATLQKRNRTLFRATLVGLSKDDAVSVCKRLKKQRQDCMVVQAGPVELAAR